MDGGRWIAKFYRPGRWSLAAITEEHELLAVAAAADVAVVAGVVAADGSPVAPIGTTSACALFPRRAGRTFDADTTESLLRIGALVGRLHRAVASLPLAHRLQCTVAGSTTHFLAELRDAGVVHPDCAAEFFALSADLSAAAQAAFATVAPALIPIHGDLHRGNILDRGPEGLLLIDLDDAARGPAVQDLWMLTPGRVEECWAEWELLLEGYRQFRSFDERQLELIEPLRYMRMIYFLAWQCRQRHDLRFAESNPDWGTRAFWIREIEDLREQHRVMQC